MDFEERPTRNATKLTETWPCKSCGANGEDHAMNRSDQMAALKKPLNTRWRSPLSTGGLLAVLLVCAGSDSALAVPTAAQALKLRPVQREVEYDQPAAAQVSKCTIKVDKPGQEDRLGRSATETVEFSGILPIRTGDKKVDQWRYFRAGLEVYRDIDANFNGKADQYRWFHTGGSRWGLDKNEDGRIDGWRVISAEETAAELVEALKTRNLGRFQNLLISPSELKSLGLGKRQIDRLVKKLQKAPLNFRQLASTQKLVGSSAEFVDFGGTRPGIVPAGTDGSSKDIQVYENVAVLVGAGEDHHQVQLGTLVRVGLAWRLIDAPALGDNVEVAANGFFFHGPAAARQPSQEAVAQNSNGPSEAVQKIMAELDQLDKQPASSKTRQATANARRAELLEKLVRESKTADQREQWLRQLARCGQRRSPIGHFPRGRCSSEETRNRTGEEQKLEKDGGLCPVSPDVC